MPTVQDERIAELVVQRRLLTPAQVSECQQLQHQSATPCTLAQVIVSRRYATPDALRALALGPGQTHGHGSTHGGSTSSGPGLPARAARPTGFFPTAQVQAQAQAGAGAGAAAEDPEVAFGRFLIAEGLLTAEQTREGYKLLTGYRQQFPQVNLSQVLAKHGLCDKEALRGAYQRFVGQREGGGHAPPGPGDGNAFACAYGASQGAAEDMATLEGPAGAATWGAPSGSEPRFGFKTVELDPQERPDYAQGGPPAPPPGSAVFSPFASPAGAQGPPLDPGTLDDFLPVDSGAQRGAPPRFVESETLIERPRGAAPYAGPARTGPGATAGESRWTNETGPNGTHAGPRGTHRQRGFGADAGAGLLPPAQPVQLPPPLQLRPDVGEDDGEDDGDGDDDAFSPVEEPGEAVAAKGGKRRKAGDTDLQSSTFGGAAKRQRRGAPPARSGPPMGVVAAIAGGVVVVLSLGLWMIAQRMELKSAKREFLTAVGAEPAEASLARRETLPAGLLDDPEVAAALTKLQGEVDRAKARAAAEAELARLAGAKSLDERLAICNRAIDADDSFARAWVARGRVKLALARRGALQGGGADPRSLTADAMQDVDQAIVREPSSALAYLAKAQLYLINASDPESRQKAQSSLQNVITQDAGGALGALAQGLLEHVKRDWEGAIEHYGRAISADPKLVDAYLMRADARLRKRDYPNALSDAGAAARMDATSAEALTLQAEARYFSTRDASNRSGDRAGALADLDRALKLDPSNGRALALRAYARLERDRIGDLVSQGDDIELARKDGERAVLVDQEQALGHLALAEIEQAAGRIAEALRHASKAVERGRHMPVVYLVRGRLRAREGDDQAIPDFDEVLRLEPGNARALTNKAAVLIARQEFDNARAYLDQAITTDPELSEAYFQRGLIHLKSRPRQYQLAIDDLSKAIELKAQFPDAYFYRACAFSYLSQWDQCVDDLQKAEAQRRDDGAFHMRDVYLLRGHCHYQKREWREAQEAYTTYQKVAPVGARPLDKVLKRLDQIRAAIEGEAVELDGEQFEDAGR